MGSLNYVGKQIAALPDLAYKDYISQVKSADLSLAQIDDVINNGLAGYATIAYVDAQDLLNATEDYIDAQDNLRLKLAQKGLANGVCPLDATGRVPPVRINAPLTQKYLRGPWTPPAYHAAQIDATGTETTLYTTPVTDPGHPYRLVVFGMLDARSNLDAEYPIVNIRAGSATGELIAQGISAADAPDTSTPTVGEQFNAPVPDGLGEFWNQTSLAGSGGLYIVSGGEAVWDEAGTAERLWRFRRIGAPDATTQTNYQKMRLTLGAGGSAAPLFGDPQYVRGCARMNVAETDWVGFELGHDTLIMKYSVDGVVSSMTGPGWTVSPSVSVNTSAPAGTNIDILAGTFNNLRQFLFYRNDVLLCGAVDGNGVTKADTGHKGWGWYGYAGAATFGQTNAPNIAAALIADAPPSFGSMAVLPRRPDLATVRTGSTTLYIRGIRSGSAATVSFSPYHPRLSIFAVPA